MMIKEWEWEWGGYCFSCLQNLSIHI